MLKIILHDDEGLCLMIILRSADIIMNIIMMRSFWWQIEQEIFISISLDLKLVQRHVDFVDLWVLESMLQNTKCSCKLTNWSQYGSLCYPIRGQYWWCHTHKCWRHEKLKLKIVYTINRYQEQELFSNTCSSDFCRCSHSLYVIRLESYSQNIDIKKGRLLSVHLYESQSEGVQYNGSNVFMMC